MVAGRPLACLGAALLILVAGMPGSAEVVQQRVCVSDDLGAQDQDGDGLPAVYGDDPTVYRIKVKTEPVPSVDVERRDNNGECQLAGDPDDDGSSEVPTVPSSFCTPNGASGFAFEDRDQDGNLALYATGHSGEWTLEPEPGVTGVLADCWLAGDPDDDGADHTGGADIPAPDGLTFCTPNGASQLGTADKDGDGSLALYAKSRSANWTVDLEEQGYAGVRGDCWLAGDPDDDGAEHAGGTDIPAPDGASFCTPNGASEIATADKDGDGEPALYAMGHSADWTVDEDGAAFSGVLTDCWLAGDADDDGMARWPAAP